MKKILITMFALPVLILPVVANAAGTLSGTCFPAVECEDNNYDYYGNPLNCYPKVDSCPLLGQSLDKTSFSCSSGCYKPSVSAPVNQAPSCPVLKLSDGTTYLSALSMAIGEDGLARLYSCGANALFENFSQLAFGKDGSISNTSGPVTIRDNDGLIITTDTGTEGLTIAVEDQYQLSDPFDPGSDREEWTELTIKGPTPRPKGEYSQPFPSINYEGLVNFSDGARANVGGYTTGINGTSENGTGVYGTGGARGVEGLSEGGTGVTGEGRGEFSEGGEFLTRDCTDGLGRCPTVTLAQGDNHIVLGSTSGEIDGMIVSGNTIWNPYTFSNRGILIDDKLQIKKELVFTGENPWNRALVGATSISGTEEIKSPSLDITAASSRTMPYNVSSIYMRDDSIIAGVGRYFNDVAKFTNFAGMQGTYDGTTGILDLFGNKINVSGKISNPNADNGGNVYIDDTLQIERLTSTTSGHNLDLRGYASIVDSVGDSISVLENLDVQGNLSNSSSTVNGGVVLVNDDFQIDGDADVNGKMDAEEYCINGANCITSWPSGGGNYWKEHSIWPNKIFYDIPVTSNEYVGINTNNPLYMLHVGGSAANDGGGSWLNGSDIRLKDIKGDFVKGLNEILQLHPIEYNYKVDNARGLSSEKDNIGFIAQEVQPIFPEAVIEGKDGYLDFDMHPVNVALINAIKELKAENDALKEVVCEIKPEAEICN